MILKNDVNSEKVFQKKEIKNQDSGGGENIER